MINSIKKLFSIFPAINAVQFGLFRLMRNYLNSRSITTYSQTGEDRILMSLFSNKQNGFYVEVGSNHPINYSNTFALYCNGWRGITIDANIDMVNKHKQMRLRDIAICEAVSDIEEDVVFVEYNTHELSTINQNIANVLEKKEEIIKRKTRLKTTTLSKILETHLPSGVSIDILSIDVEGHDMNVLKSLDFKRYRPKVIVVEMHNFRFETYKSNELYEYLNGHGYTLVGYAIWNGYFLDEQFLK